jgi:hypothetical protein
MDPVATLGASLPGYVVESTWKTGIVCPMPCACQRSKRTSPGVSAVGWIWNMLPPFTRSWLEKLRRRSRRKYPTRLLRRTSSKYAPAPPWSERKAFVSSLPRWS